MNLGAVAPTAAAMVAVISSVVANVRVVLVGRTPGQRMSMGTRSEASKKVCLSSPNP